VLWAAIAAAAGGAALGAAGARLATARRFAPLLTLASFTATGVALLLLTASFLTGDLSYTYVFANTDDRYPLYLKLAGLWAGRQGSLMVMAWTLATAMLAREVWWRRRDAREGEAARDGGDAQDGGDARDGGDAQDGGNARDGGDAADRVRDNYRAVFRAFSNALVAVFLIGVVTDSPFKPTDSFLLNIMPHGDGLPSPLESGFMAVHPPPVFIAYALCALLAAGGLARLATGYRGGDSGGITIRLAWWTMTVGIGLGSMWAYVSLGYGGFWGWDPIETANLLPWLLLTALLHTRGSGFLAAEMAADRAGGGSEVAWSPFASLLAVHTFTTALVATFVVRSGVWESVHDYAGPGGGDPLGRLWAALRDNPAAAAVFAVMMVMLVSSLVLFAAAVRRNMRDPPKGAAREDGEALTPWTARGRLELTMGLLVAGLLVTLALFLRGPDAQSPSAYYSRALFIVIPLLMLLANCSLPPAFSTRTRCMVIPVLPAAGIVAWAVFPDAGVWAFAAGVALTSALVVAAGTAMTVAARMKEQGCAAPVEGKGRRVLPGACPWRLRSTWRGVMHLGIVTVLLGVAVHQGSYVSVDEGRVGYGAPLEADGNTVHLKGLGLWVEGGGTTDEMTEGMTLQLERVSVALVVNRGGPGQSAMTVELRWHEGDGEYIPIPAVRTRLFTDYYVTILNVTLSDGRNVVAGGGRVYVERNTSAEAAIIFFEVKPGVPLLWSGLALTLGGSGLLMLTPASAVSCRTRSYGGGRGGSDGTGGGAGRRGNRRGRAGGSAKRSEPRMNAAVKSAQGRPLGTVHRDVNKGDLAS
jgi:cytochrome c biogenesis factor